MGSLRRIGPTCTVYLLLVEKGRDDDPLTLFFHISVPSPDVSWEKECGPVAPRPAAPSLLTANWVVLDGEGRRTPTLIPVPSLCLPPTREGDTGAPR